MTQHFHRRRFLAATLGGAAACAMPRAVWGQAAGALQATPLRGGLAMISGAGGNVVAGVDDSGVLLVDGGAAARSAELLELVSSHSGGKPVRTVINTHWRPDFTGSNVALAERGAKIVAHENTRLWLTQTIEPPYEDRVYQPLPEAARPGVTTYDSGMEPFAGGEARYQYMLQAHTDGDLYVHFPEANVIAAGGALTSDGWPMIDWWTGGWIGSGSQNALDTVTIPTSGGLVAGLQRIMLAADDDTIIVPGYGPAIGLAELRSQIQMYSDLAGTLRDMLFNGQSPEDVLGADPLAGVRPEWGSHEAFLVRAFESLWPHLTPDA